MILIAILIALTPWPRVDAEASELIDPPWVDEGWDLPELSVLCSGATYMHDCAKAIDKHLLSQHAREATRQGDSLLITLDSGRVMAIADVNCDCAGAATHFYLGRSARAAFHVVFVSQYEGYSYLLVSAPTGDIFRVDGYPLIAPDGRRVAAASCDLLAGYLPNQLDVWSIEGGRLSLEWRLRVEPGVDQRRAGQLSWGPIKPVWAAATDIRFCLRVHSMRGAKHIEMDTSEKLRLRFENGRWQLSDVK